jgi:hypothetical protein
MASSRGGNNCPSPCRLVKQEQGEGRDIAYGVASLQVRVTQGLLMSSRMACDARTVTVQKPLSRALLTSTPVLACQSLFTAHTPHPPVSLVNRAGDLGELAITCAEPLARHACRARAVKARDMHRTFAAARCRFRCRHSHAAWRMRTRACWR